MGKSLITLDLCARITTGRPFPDGAPGGEPAAVVILSAEDRARNTVLGRLRAAGGDVSRAHVFERAPGEEFLRLPGHLDRLEGVLAQTGARYVVLDPIMSYLDSSVNVASDQRVRAALAPLADLADRRHCTIQMVRHLNKGTGRNALYRGLYSIGFVASCRVTWFAARDPHLAHRYVLAQPKSNYDPPQPSLAYTIDTDAPGPAHIAWHGACPWNDADLLKTTPARFRARQRAMAFLESILKDGPRTTREIWKAAGPLHLSRATLHRARKRLKIRSIRVGLCKPEQTCYWLLPHQNLPPEVAKDEMVIDWEAMLREQMKQLGERSPLDEMEER